MKRWISSDYHFNHKNIAGPLVSEWKTGYRNFSSVDEMNEKILGNLNSTVSSEDILYFLGDFAFGANKDESIPKFFERINCRNIIFLLGNHDKWFTQNEYSPSGHIAYNRLEKVVSHLEIRIKGTLVVLNHYPLTIWNEQAKGAIHLHGHCHGNFKGEGRIKDVGVDTNNMYPYDLDKLVADMVTWPVGEPKDHHNSKQKGW